MSKLNRGGKKPSTNIRTVAAQREEKLGLSANGNLQFVKQPLVLLYEIAVSTMFGKGMGYKSSDTLVKELRQHVKNAVEQKAFDFVANLAIHARGEMNIRTIPIVLVVEFAKALADKRAPYVAEINKIKTNWSSKLALPEYSQVRVNELQAAADEYNYGNMRQLVCDVIQRADQITDLYAYALDVFSVKGKIPIAIKRGVADAFNKFSEYQFAKYNRGDSVKFRDVLRIVHPKAKDEAQGAVFDKIMKDTLETPYTWETQLSANGQRGVERKSDKQLWTELVQSGQMGYMALLRNLRNISQAGLDSSVVREYVTDVISDQQRVLKSKQLPFDFMEAYNVIKPLDGKMATAVSQAMDYSVANVPKMGKRVWLIIDYSGSMGGESDYSTTHKSAFSTALLLGAALAKASANADDLAITVFGSSAKTLKNIDTNNSVFALKTELGKERTGGIAGSTNFHAALKEKSNLKFEPDTIIVLSDGDVNSFPYSALRDVSDKKDVVKLVVNLSASSTTPFSQKDGWYPISGWAPAMFKWVPAIRNKESIVDQLSVPYTGVPKRTKKTEESAE